MKGPFWLMLLLATSATGFAQQPIALPAEDLAKLHLFQKQMEKQEKQPDPESVLYLIGGTVKNHTDWELASITIQFTATKVKPYFVYRFTVTSFTDRITGLVGTLLPKGMSNTKTVTAVPKSHSPSGYGAKIVEATGWKKPAAGSLAGGLFAEICREHNKEAIELMQRRPALLDSGDGVSGTLPIHIAAASDNVEILTYLLRTGSRVEAANKNGLTPLHAAARTDSANAVRFLLQQGANIEGKKPGGSTPLLSATMYGCDEAAYALLVAGANVTKADDNGSTALYWAARNQSAPKVLDLLLKNGALVNATDNNGVTPLHAAAYYDEKDYVKALLQAGAKVNVQTIETGDTPLHFAARAGHAEAIAMLISKRANLEIVDLKGDTPLIVAVGNEEPECVEALLTAGAKVTALRKNGDTPLHVAVGQGSPSLTNRLLQAGAAVDALNLNGETALLVACASRLPSTTSVLIAAGAKVALARAKDGYTPLHAAAEVGSVQCVRILLASNAPINVKNARGQTPLDLARLHNNTTCAGLITAAASGSDGR